MKVLHYASLGGAMLMVTPAVADAPHMHVDFPGHHMWNTGIGWLVGPVMLLLFIGLAATIIALVIRWVFALGSALDGAGKKWFLKKHRCQ